MTASRLELFIHRWCWSIIGMLVLAIAAYAFVQWGQAKSECEDKGYAYVRSSGGEYVCVQPAP